MAAVLVSNPVINGKVTAKLTKEAINAMMRT
jgi:hypothetical protein